MRNSKGQFVKKGPNPAICIRNLLTGEVAVHLFLPNGHVCLLDLEDYLRPEICETRWFSKNKGRKIARSFLGRGKDRRYVEMHQIIMGTPEGMHTHHINHDTLDNRRTNLTVCKPQENFSHKLTKKQRRGKYKGVYQVKGYPNRHRAQIGYNYDTIFLGSFDTPEEAAKAYNERAKELYGEFACLNQI